MVKDYHDDTRRLEIEVSMRKLPPIEELRKLLELNPDGTLIWKERSSDIFKNPSHCNAWNTRYAGQPALHGFESRGYRYGKINDVSYLAHRIVYALAYGVDPGEKQVDHINHVRADNRPENLRLVTHHENHRNKRLAKNNTSGVCGVRYHRRDKKYQAEIKIDGTYIFLGSFADINEAIAARKDAERKYGYHENHGG